VETTGGTAAEQDEARAYGRKVLLLSATATFIAFLDVTVVNVAFPSLQEDFPRSDLATLSWVLTSYAVLFAALLTPAGRLADVVGRRRLFVIGVALFTAASAASAAAPSVEVLIAARAVQGLAAAAMIPSSLGMLLAATPPDRRKVAVGLWGAAASFAAAAGPSLGGVLVDLTDWRSVFVINVPIGLLALVGLRSLKEVKTGETHVPDVVATVMLAVGVGAVVVGITKGTDWEWGSVATLGCIVGGIALVALAAVRSLRHPHPAIEMSLWRNRTFSAGNATSFLFGAAVYAWMLLAVITVTTFWHYSILEAGLAVSPGAVTAAGAAIIAGRVAEKRGERAVVVLGILTLLAAGIWLRSAVTTEPAFVSLWLPTGVLAGIGIGAALTGLSSAAAMSVAPQRFAAATGLNMTARQLGGAVGIAVLAAILESERAEGLTAFTDVYLFVIIVAAASVLPAFALSRPTQARDPVAGRSDRPAVAAQAATPRPEGGR
jgi:EmrB/QacA subfamily drug resistance transporter